MTPSLKIKKMWRDAKSGLSLKQFARTLQAKGDLTGADWFANKGPAQKNLAKAERLKNKGARISAEKTATRASKQKRSSGNQKRR